MTRVLLLRHGESEWNADGRWQGQADPPLSELGRAQAAEAATAIGTVDAIITSDLQRAAETGVIIARLLGVDHVAENPGLRERDAGPLSGLTRSEIHATFPGLLADDPAGFRPGPDGTPDWPRGWEPDADLLPRVEVALTAVAIAVPDGDVVVVSHGGVIYALERRLGGQDRGRLSNLGGVTLDVASDGTMSIGERVSLVVPSHTHPIEADRI